MVLVFQQHFIWLILHHLIHLWHKTHSQPVIIITITQIPDPKIDAAAKNAPTNDMIATNFYVGAK